MAFACSFRSPISHELSAAGQATAHKLRISPAKCRLFTNSKRTPLIWTQIRAVKANHPASDQVKQNTGINGEESLEMEDYVKGNGNGAAAATTARDAGRSGLAGSHLNENVEWRFNKHGERSPRLVKHVNENGISNEVVQEIPDLKMESEAIVKVEVEKKKKQKVEEIGQEEAWFKKSGEDKAKAGGSAQ